MLAGSYSPAVMRPVHRKLIHNLGPKVRLSLMIRAGAAPGRLVDLAGLVTWHGHWERESVT